MSVRSDNIRFQLESIAQGAPWTIYNEIEKGFYVGEDPAGHGFGRLKHPKTDVIVSLNESPPTTIYSDLKATLWMPIHDRPPFPGIKWLESVVDWLIDAHDVQGWSVYLHCRVGVSRSGMVAIAYFMKRDSLKLERAALMIAMKRAIVPNPSFMEGLVEWEEYLEQ